MYARFLWIFTFCLNAVASLYAVNPLVQQVAPQYNIGDYAQGGVIFWLTPDRTHGIVADIVDLDGGSGIAWETAALTNEVVGATATRGIVFGANYETPGSINSDLILNYYGTMDGSYAALLCAQRSVTVDGVTYDDWYLPSLDELGTMLARQATIDAVAIAHGGEAFASASYWSSFESSRYLAYYQEFGDASQGGLSKAALLRVRAARAF